MLAHPRISQAVFSGEPKRRLYFIAFESSSVSVAITDSGDVEMDARINEEPPEGILGEWIEQVSKDATEAHGGDSAQLSDTIVRGLADA